MSRWRSWTGWLGLLICVGLAAALVLVRPDLATDRFSVVPPGADGWGRTTAFDTRIDAIVVTDAVATRPGGEPLATEHRWVVVEYRVVAHRDRLVADAVWLITASGDRYAARPEFAAWAPASVDPGFTATATVVFEVPDDVHGPTTLRVGPLHGERRTWDVVVDLPIEVPDSMASQPDPRSPAVEVTR